jgi:hypothetical protein
VVRNKDTTNENSGDKSKRKIDKYPPKTQQSEPNVEHETKLEENDDA